MAFKGPFQPKPFYDSMKLSLTNIIAACDEGTGAVDKGKAVGVIVSLDFSKAFDAVSHPFLFTKLAGFCLSKWVIRLLQIEELVDMLEMMPAGQAGEVG